MSIWVLGTQGRHRRSALWGLYSWCQTMTFPSVIIPQHQRHLALHSPHADFSSPSLSPEGWWDERRDYRSWLRQAALSLPGWARCLTAQLHPSQHRPTTVESGQFSRELHCPPQLPQLPQPPQPQRGCRVGGGQRRQWWKCHWRQEGWVLEEMEERSSPWLAWQPGCLAVWFISFQTDICNFPKHPVQLRPEVCRVVRIQNRASKDYKQNELPNSLWFVKSLNSVSMMSGVLSFHAMHLLDNI